MKARTLPHSVSALLSVLFGAIVLLYWREIGQGIRPWSPPCAPTRESAVVAVFGFAAVGLALAVGGLLTAQRTGFWMLVGLLGVAMNLAALAMGGHWISAETLLPCEA